MSDRSDLALLLTSRIPLICIRTQDEHAILKMLTEHALNGVAREHKPLFRWSVTDGLQRLDIELAPQALNSDPGDVLAHIRAVSKPGFYALLDFHPYLDDPLRIRQVKDICQRFQRTGGKLILISPNLRLPDELKHLSADFEMAVPDDSERQRIVQNEAKRWRDENGGKSVRSDPRALSMLVRNLAGLSDVDVRRLAHNAISDDGVIDQNDIDAVMLAKYKLLNQDGLLNFEYDTARFSEVAGMQALKNWLGQRRKTFLGETGHPALDPPRGLVLLGVQGCGKSLAAKATAGAFSVPLLRLEFGQLFNKYHGETERNLRESLKLAETMAPCVLWIDEMEKGLSTGNDNTGTAQRVMGQFLTWMAERSANVFVVATANDITRLPPELVRKGRFDEIFFVDLPDKPIRERVLSIHLQKRETDCSAFDLSEIADATDGFSGAELEQLVVSAFYAAVANDEALQLQHLIAEAKRTSPLSTVMAEDIEHLRQWARSRTVSAH